MDDSVVKCEIGREFFLKEEIVFPNNKAPPNHLLIPLSLKLKMLNIFLSKTGETIAIPFKRNATIQSIKDDLTKDNCLLAGTFLIYQTSSIPLICFLCTGS